MENVLKYLMMVLGVLVITVLSALIIGWFVMLFWNWLMPILFGLKTITYIQGWGLVVLSGLLIKPTVKVNAEK